MAEKSKDATPAKSVSHARDIAEEKRGEQTAPEAAAGVRPPSGAWPEDVSALPFNTQAQIVADNIANELATNPDASLVGMTITESELQISVAGAASAALAKAISNQAAGLPVSIRVVNHNAAQLAAVQGQISADSNYWASQGIRITTLGPDLATNKVHVSLGDYTSSAAQAIITRYGDEWVSVNPVSVNVEPM